MSFNNNTNTQGSLRGAANTKMTADAFIPELWSSEVKRFLDQKMVATQYTKKIPFQGKKGDRIHIPNISRTGVFDKLPETPVNLQARTESDYYLDIDKYKESSFLIEDLVGIQAAYNLRAEYTRESGYALARDIDASVLGLRAAVNNVVSATSSQVVLATQSGSNFIGTVPTAAPTGTIAATQGAPLNFSSILLAKQTLDRNDIPEEDRVLIVSPTQYNQLLAVDKFISMFYRDYSPVLTGEVGRIFNIPVVMTSQVGVNSATGYSNGQTTIPTPGVSGTGAIYLPTQDPFTSLPTAWGTAPSVGANEVHTAILCHKDWAAVAMQKQPSAESDRQVLYQGDAVVMTQLYGMKLFRPTNAVLIHTSGGIPAVV